MLLRDLLQDMATYLRVWGVQRHDRRTGEDPAADHLVGRERRLVEALHPPRMQLTVTEVIEETPTTRTLRFERADGPLPPFRPGAYVNLFVDLDGVRTSRPYSISSAPGAPHLDLTVREKAAGFVSPHLVRRVAPGDRFESTGPLGHFHHEPLIHGERLVLLAGGCGVTPFMSIIRDQQRRAWPLDVTLLYGSRTSADVVFADELRALAEGAERFALVEVISEPEAGFSGAAGLLDAARIGSEVADIAGCTAMVCGPNAMLELCVSALAKLGVPAHRVVQELHGPPADVRGLDGWPVDVGVWATFEVVVGDRVFQAPADEPLMASLERHGLVVPAECRSGECSACRTHLVSGRVFAPPAARVRYSDRQSGRIHPCVSYPVSDLEIRL